MTLKLKRLRFFVCKCELLNLFDTSSRN